MPALDQSRRWTREEVLALPDDGNRYELVDGELLVSPAPRPLHERAVAELFRRLDPFVSRNRLGTLYASPADLDLTTRELVQPDLFVSTRRGIADWEEVGVPLLVIEVLSPKTAHFDRVKKRVKYQKAGVPTLWIVDLDSRLVEVWGPDADRPTISVATLTWRPTPATMPTPSVPEMQIDLPAFFTAVDEA